MATAPYSFPYPSVATYPPPPPFPDGNYYPSPFPYASPPAPGFFLTPAYGPSIFVPPPSPPPAYPYPPPASGYAPLPGFFPAQPYDPSTVPYATTSSCPTSEATPIPTNIERNWPPSAPDSIPSILSPTPSPGDSLFSSATSTSRAPVFGNTAAASSPATTATATPSAVIFPACSKMTTNCVHQVSHDTMLHQASAPVLLESAEPQARAETTISEHMPSAVLDIKRRLDEHRAQSQLSFASLQGQLSKLRHKLSSLTPSIVPTSASSTTTAPTPDVGFTPSSESKTSAASSSVYSITATASVTPEVFGEMPQPYGFSNLDRQSVFLADGSEHSYYALPEDYSSKQDTEGIFSFTSEKKCDTVLFAVCYNNISDNAFSEEAADLTFPHAPVIHADRSIKLTIEKSTQATSTLFVHEAIVHCHVERPEDINCTNGLKPVQLKFEQEDILLCGVVSDVVDSKAWEIGSPPSHSINHVELRLLWDPGALLPLMSKKTQHFSQALQPTSHAKILAGPSVTRFSECKCLPFWVQNNMYVLWKSETGMTVYISWDPGILNIIYMMLDKYTVANSVQFIQWTVELLFLSLTVCIHYMAPNGINFVLHAMSFILQRAAYLSQGNDLCSLHCNSMLITESCPMKCLWEFSVSCTTLRFQFGVSTCVPQQSCYCRVPSSQESHGIQSLWDPGIVSLMDMMFGNTAVPNLFPIGVHIHRIPLADCSTLLPPTQITTSDSSKVEVDELTSPCVVLHLQQSTKWTSTSPNGIASSEYAYTLDFITDQWELHKQGVQKSYSAMSSPNYLQILEMDILFITFLPP